jgi:Glycosyltransferase family 87
MYDRLRRMVDQAPGPLWAVTAVFAFVGVVCWLSVTTWHQLSSSRLDVGLLTDFRDAVYYPVVALRDGVNPYAVDTYYRHYPVGQEFPLYTPQFLLLNSPLLLFSFPTARAIAFGWNMTLVLGYSAAVLGLLGARIRVAPLFGLATLILLSDPGRFDLRTGQPTLLIAIGVLAALRAVPRADVASRIGPGRSLPILLGVAGLATVWIKPTFAIPLAVLLIARTRVRLVVLGTLVAAALSAVVLPFLVDAAGGLGHLIDSWRESARITSQSGQSRLGTSLRIDIGNTFVRITKLHISETAAMLGGLVLLAVGVWLVARLHHHDPGRDCDELAITLVCLLLLTSTYHVPYDYLLLVGPIALLLRPATDRGVRWPPRVRTTVTVLLLIPLIDPLGWSPVNATVGTSGFEWLLGTTMMSTYVLVALGLCAWTAWRQGSATPVMIPPITRTPT